ncbi:hypothetical protein TREMEDRAFT_23530, partial [Tremella mesenterica DSM 1558]|uniref:uncharacterized protein n=1 Tax=Tremella mesenterica (strain ATCC 24925 / CBS 8224 / DSM 1558 / NBRC 9311 / NRRL Y-6157 / RJB 2259-6 / UBC 559-6) TaxID=578456 RepID=UPI0003F49590
KLGIIFGTHRTHSNTLGIFKYIQQIISTYPTIQPDPIFLGESLGHPLPLLIDQMPASIPLASCPEAYTLPEIRAWSNTVLGWDGILIVAPQYNRGPPAVLKNAFDQLYSEWEGVPIGLVSCGSRGGNRMQIVLEEMLGDGLKMDLVGMVGVKIPKESILGDEKVKGDEDWVKGYEGDLKGLLNELEGKMKKRFQKKKID